MAIKIIPIAKPSIWLSGQARNSSDGTFNEFAKRVDHAVHLNPVTTTIIAGGVTKYDEEDILTFEDEVRIIITTNCGSRFNYAGISPKLEDTVFEGNRTYSPNINEVNELPETFYTLNGKDPIRTAAHLYNFLDRNETTDDEKGGFLLSTSPTGSEFITLKARTYWFGKKSRIAIARFKIAKAQKNLDFENRP